MQHSKGDELTICCHLPVIAAKQHVRLLCGSLGAQCRRAIVRSRYCRKRDRDILESHIGSKHITVTPSEPQWRGKVVAKICESNFRPLVTNLRDELMATMTKRCWFKAPTDPLSIFLATLWIAQA